MSALEVITSEQSGRELRHSFERRGPIWLGRDSSCEVVLDSELVSRRHARLEWLDGALLLTDCSANGTHLDGHTLRQSAAEVCDRSELGIGPFRVRVVQHTDDADAAVAKVPSELRRRIQRQLLEHLDLSRLKATHFDGAAMRPRVADALKMICEAHSKDLPSLATRRALVRELSDEALGLGPLERLLADTEVTEIMVVDRSTIYVERRGLIEETGLSFTDDEAVRSVIERIVTPLGRRIDESTPIVDARLADGSRVNAIIPPLASRGPCITIRKFSQNALSLDDLVARGSLTRRMADFLCCAVKARKNIVIAGGTGSGKTTLLNVLSAAIPERERIVTIEDAAELRLQQKHVVSLEARPANLEGKGAYTIRDLVRNALRMRPDRIVVGECRGGEAIDMLQAMNTGHDGSMTTTHANSPIEAVARIETLCLMAGLDLPIAAIRAQIATSVHLVVQQSRFADGTRRVTCISEVGNVDEHGEVELHDIHRFERTGTDPQGKILGEYRATGHLPSFAGEFAAQGLSCWGDDP